MKLFGKRLITLVMTLSMLLTLCPMALADSASDFAAANAKNNVVAVGNGAVRTLKATKEGMPAKLSFDKPSESGTYYAAVRATDAAASDKEVHYVDLQANGSKLELQYFQYDAKVFEAQLVKPVPCGGTSSIGTFYPSVLEYTGDSASTYPIQFSANLTMSDTMAHIADTCYRLNIYPMQFIEFWSHIRFNYAYDMSACQAALESIVKNGIISEIYTIDPLANGKTKCVADSSGTKCIGFDIKCNLKPDFYQNSEDDYWSTSTVTQATKRLTSPMQYNGSITLTDADIKQAVDDGNNLYFYGWNSIVNAPTVDDRRVDDTKSVSHGDVNVPAVAKEVIVTRKTTGDLTVTVKGGPETAENPLNGAKITLTLISEDSSRPVTYTATTDSSGSFVFNGIKIGQYKVEVSYNDGDTDRTYSTTVTHLFQNTEDTDECTLILNWPYVPEGKDAEVDTEVVSTPSQNRGEQSVSSSNVNIITNQIVTSDYLTKIKGDMLSTENTTGAPITLAEAYEAFSKAIGEEDENYRRMEVLVELNVTKVENPDRERGDGQPVGEIIDKADTLLDKAYASVDTKVNSISDTETQLVIPSYIDAVIDERIEFWQMDGNRQVTQYTKFEDDIHDTVEDAWYTNLDAHQDFLVTFSIPVPEELQALLDANGKTLDDIKVFRFHDEDTTYTEPTIELRRYDLYPDDQEYYEIITSRNQNGEEQNYIQITARFYSVFGFGVELGSDAVQPDVKPDPTPGHHGGGSSRAELNKTDHYGYIIGYPVDYETGEKTSEQPRMPVRPEANITRAEVATIYFRMLTDASREELWSQENSFSDVPQSAWFNAAVSTLTNGGILTGDPDGRFRPNDPITRAEFATIAVRFFGGSYAGADLFPDIATHWAENNINLAAQNGLINGYPDGTFRPNQNITRAEAITIVNRTLDRHPDKSHFLPDMLVWPDNKDTSAWYYADMQEATNSHKYDMKGSGDSKYEIWTKMLPIRDWVQFEKEWSDAHSASNPGEVVNVNK